MRELVLLKTDILMKTVNAIGTQPACAAHTEEKEWPCLCKQSKGICILEAQLWYKLLLNGKIPFIKALLSFLTCSFTFYLFISCVWAHASHNVLVAVRGQTKGVGIKLRCQAWQHAPLPLNHPTGKKAFLNLLLNCTAKY